MAGLGKAGNLIPSLCCLVGTTGPPTKLWAGPWKPHCSSLRGGCLSHLLGSPWGEKRSALVPGLTPGAVWLGNSACKLELAGLASEKLLPWESTSAPPDAPNHTRQLLRGQCEAPRAYGHLGTVFLTQLVSCQLGRKSRPPGLGVSAPEPGALSRTPESQQSVNAQKSTTNCTSGAHKNLP